METTMTTGYDRHAIRAEIDRQGRRIDWIAAQAGYTRPYVSLVLTGVMPVSSEFARRLGRVLGVDDAESQWSSDRRSS